MAMRFRRPRMDRAQTRQFGNRPPRRLQPVKAVENDKTPGILRSGVIDPVINIINSLNPVSYLKLSMTSKGMRQFCRHSRVRMELKDEYMTVFYDKKTMEPGLMLSTELTSEDGVKEVQDVEGYVNMVNKIQMTLPVTIAMDSIVFMGSDSEDEYECYVDLVNFVSRFLKRAGISRVAMVTVEGRIHTWEALVNFVTEFRVQLLDICDCPYEDSVFKQLCQQNLCALLFNPMMPVTGWILGSPISRIHSPAVAATAIKPMFDQWMTTVSLVKWTVVVWELDVHLDKGLLDFLNDYSWLAFDYDGTLPTKRPLVFSTNDEKKDTTSYFVLREDQNVIRLTVHDAFCISLRFPKLTKCPLAIRKLYNC